MNLLEFLLTWARSLEEWLDTRGIVLTFGASPQDHLRRSVWVTISCPDEESELILWESGEAEFACQHADGEIVQEHHEIANIGELGRLLSCLLMCIN